MPLCSHLLSSTAESSSFSMIFVLYRESTERKNVCASNTYVLREYKREAYQWNTSWCSHLSAHKAEGRAPRKEGITCNCYLSVGDPESLGITKERCPPARDNQRSYHCPKLAMYQGFYKRNLRNLIFSSERCSRMDFISLVLWEKK